jgi:hypothetical protein
VLALELGVEKGYVKLTNRIRLQPFALATVPLGHTGLLYHTTQPAPTQLNDEAVLDDSD